MSIVSQPLLQIDDGSQDRIWGDECVWDFVDDPNDEVLSAFLDETESPPRHYVMEEGGSVRPAASLREAMEMYSPENFDKHKRVALTNLWFGAITVSTVFLGLDHNFVRGGDPILFETMIFGGPYHNEMKRYRTVEEALIGHEEMVAEAGKLDNLWWLLGSLIGRFITFCLNMSFKITKITTKETKP